jgi:hypothetical protein
MTKKSLFTFSLFFGLMSSIPKIVICILRRIRNKEDKYNSIIAGLVGSLAAFGEPNQNTRQLVSLYLFSRSIDSFMKTLNSNRIMKELF